MLYLPSSGYMKYRNQLPTSPSKPLKKPHLSFQNFSAQLELCQEINSSKFCILFVCQSHSLKENL